MHGKRLAKYLLLTFAISYACWGGLAVLIRLGAFCFTDPPAVVLHLLGGFGPAFAALAVLETKRTAKAVLRFVFGYKKKSAVFLALFFVLETATVAFSSRERNPMMPLWAIPLVFAQAIFLYGGEEELGWRGVMQPELEKSMPFALAVLLTGAVWAAWHIPLWFVDGATQQGIPFSLFALLAVLQSVWYAAVYRRTRSVFFCSVLHGLTNTLLSAYVIKINAVLAAGFLLMTAVAFIVARPAAGGADG